MTFLEQIEIMRATYETGLPTILAEANPDVLEGFAQYRKDSPTKPDQKQLCVYLGPGNNSTDAENRSFIVQLQLYKVNEIEQIQYFERILEFTKENITPSILGLEGLNNIEWDIWPIDKDGNGAFVFFQLDFRSSLDDCL